MDSQFSNIYWSNQIPKPVNQYSVERHYENQEAKNQVKNQVQRNQQNLREPSIDNPFMNPPITAFDTEQLYSDYSKFSTNGQTKFNEDKISNQSDKFLINKLYQDPADGIFQRNNSQRQFYSVPVGSVPSDQTGFSNWLYGNNQVCKAGSIWMKYDNAYSDDSLICNGYNASTPTNFGRLE